MMGLFRLYTQEAKQESTHSLNSSVSGISSITGKAAPAGGTFNIKYPYAIRPKFTWQIKAKKELHISYNSYNFICSKHLLANRFF